MRESVHHFLVKREGVSGIGFRYVPVDAQGFQELAAILVGYVGHAFPLRDSLPFPERVSRPRDGEELAVLYLQGFFEYVLGFRDFVRRESFVNHAGLQSDVQEYRTVEVAEFRKASYLCLFLYRQVVFARLQFRERFREGSRICLDGSVVVDGERFAEHLPAGYRVGRGFPRDVDSVDDFSGIGVHVGGSLEFHVAGEFQFFFESVHLRFEFRPFRIFIEGVDFSSLADGAGETSGEFFLSVEELLERLGVFLFGFGSDLVDCYRQEVGFFGGFLGECAESVGEYGDGVELFDERYDFHGAVFKLYVLFP